MSAKKIKLAFGTTILMVPAMAFSAACEGAQIAGVASCDAAPLEARITSIINSLFFVIGAVAVLVLLYGAIRYITSTGDASRVKAAKDTIIYAIAGLVVAILAPAIVGFVIGSLF